MSNCHMLAVDHDAAANGDFHNLCGRKFPTFPGITFLSPVWAAIITCSEKSILVKCELEAVFSRKERKKKKVNYVRGKFLHKKRTKEPT